VKALLLGASAGLARALAEALAAEGYAVLLAGGDARDLEATASHLRLRFGVQAATCDCRVGQDGWLERLAQALRDFGPPDAALFPIGAARDDDLGDLGLEAARGIVEVNFLAVAATVSGVLPAMLERGSGVIAGFGSVASARGRSRNVVYSAAKRALDSYFESLRHLTAATGVRIQYFHLGFVDTERNVGRRLLLPAAAPEVLARRIVRRLRGGSGSFYLPWYWRWIVLALRLLPGPLYRRLSF
jgi:short-subunit dehydrogenase